METLEVYFDAVINPLPLRIPGGSALWYATAILMGGAGLVFLRVF